MPTKRSRNWLNSLPTWLLKLSINSWFPLLGAGIRITSMSADYRHIEVQLKLRWCNKNYVGTHFGGSIYSMTDPFYMLILIKNLGANYIVWDKAATIEFKKPGRGTLHATFQFSEEDIQSIRNQADQNGKYTFDVPVNVLNEDNEVVASVVKTLYVRRKNKE